VVKTIIINEIAPDLPILKRLCNYYQNLDDKMQKTYKIIGYIWYLRNQKSVAIRKLEKFYQKEEEIILDLNIGYDAITDAIWDYISDAEKNSKIADQLIRQINNPHYNFEKVNEAKKQLIMLNHRHSRVITKLVNYLDWVSDYLETYRH
jgi:hypothetical protein